MRRVVIDTNILVRAFLKKGGSDDRVFRMFVRGEMELFYSLDMIEEFLRIMYYPRIKRRTKFDHGQVELFVRMVTTDGRVVTAREVDICRDKKDNMVLGTAMASLGKKKVYLVTADEDLLELKGKLENIEILTPGEFLKSA